MARGIIYVMSTVVPGLIKIGKTGSDQFAKRMYNLERNGYANVVGLKREFAIEVDNYDEKELLLDDIFSKSRIENTELFALDLDLIIQLLSSFDGVQVFPKKVSKAELFEVASEAREAELSREKEGKFTQVPDGIYQLEVTRRDFGTVKSTMEVKNGLFTVKKGCRCAPVTTDWMPESRRTAKIVDGILMEDVTVRSPSAAGWIPLGKANNGWIVWKDMNGSPIDIYRKRD